MSAAAKLDQSLDEILKSRRTNKSRGRRHGGAGKPTVKEAPVGGVKKTTKATKPAKAAPTGNAGPNSESKIIVSNLPSDVNEAAIKDYFTKTVGSVKKVMLTYGQDGVSRGIATITFARANNAAKAASQMDGIKIDNRPMKVEVILDAQHAPAPPAPKSLADRVTQPKKEKPQPKPATNTKPVNGGRGRGNKRGRGRGGRLGRGGRGNLPKKTVEELDAEMEDYFEVPGTGNNEGEAMQTNGGGAQQSGGDAAMDDEML